MRKRGGLPKIEMWSDAKKKIPIVRCGDKGGATCGRNGGDASLGSSSASTSREMASSTRSVLTRSVSTRSAERVAAAGGSLPPPAAAAPTRARLATAAPTMGFAAGSYLSGSAQSTLAYPMSIRLTDASRQQRVSTWPSLGRQRNEKRELISDIWGKRVAIYGEKGGCRRIKKK